MNKHSSYSAGFKLKVTDFAEKHGNQAAGHEFTVTQCDSGVNRNLHYKTPSTFNQPANCNNRLPQAGSQRARAYPRDKTEGVGGTPWTGRQSIAGPILITQAHNWAKVVEQLQGKHLAQGHCSQRQGLNQHPLEPKAAVPTTVQDAGMHMCGPQVYLGMAQQGVDIAGSS
uniref:Uncharacterized protein n=1 Tax=Scleropages formosus TaxID=113540 RepID=A0A8C9SZU6_SCLFO